MRKAVKRIVILLSVCVPVLAATQSKAQVFGNEWINPNQTYFKIPVGQTGFYKLTYNELQQAGFPVQTVDPRKLQLFFRGKEQPIEVAGQLDARFDPSDHIIFYGQRNDGTLDAELYVSDTAQPHPY